MTTAVYPGSFDPITLGHMDVIRRAAAIFDTVRVCILRNPNKHYWFTEDERLALIAESVQDIDNVVVDHYEGLLTDYAESVGASVVIKGLRTFQDFEYESQMDFFNKRLAPDVETLYMMADKKYSVLSSSAIRELMTFGGELAGLVPEPVIAAAARKRQTQA